MQNRSMRKVANRQTDRQTNNNDYTSSSAEVITQLVTRLPDTGRMIESRCNTFAVNVFEYTLCLTIQAVLYIASRLMSSRPDFSPSVENVVSFTCGLFYALIARFVACWQMWRQKKSCSTCVHWRNKTSLKSRFFSRNKNCYMSLISLKIVALKFLL